MAQWQASGILGAIAMAHDLVKHSANKLLQFAGQCDACRPLISRSLSLHAISSVQCRCT